MAKLSKKVDMGDIEESTFEALPAGDYTVKIVDSDIVESERTAGVVLLKLTHQVLEPEEHKDRKIFSNLCWEHPSSEAAERIARQRVKQLCTALGDPDMELRDTEELHGVVQCKVVIEQPKEGEDRAPQNKITRYLPLSGAGVVGDEKKKGKDKKKKKDK